jgi:hypothetical protein
LLHHLIPTSLNLYILLLNCHIQRNQSKTWLYFEEASNERYLEILINMKNFHAYKWHKVNPNTGDHFHKVQNESIQYCILSYFSMLNQYAKFYNSFHLPRELKIFKGLNLYYHITLLVALLLPSKVSYILIFPLIDLFYYSLF